MVIARFSYRGVSYTVYGAGLTMRDKCWYQIVICLKNKLDLEQIKAPFNKF